MLVWFYSRMRAPKTRLPERPRMRSAPVPAAVGGRAIWMACAILAVWAAALVYARDQVPPGLNNDAAQEALRGIYLVEGRHWEVITFSVGNSAETLYLYLLGSLIHAMGPTTLALQLACWPFALATIWMVWKLTERIADSVPAWVPLLTAAASLWLFHYARSGLRAITAPFFLAAFTLLLDRVEQQRKGRQKKGRGDGPQPAARIVEQPQRGGRRQQGNPRGNRIRDAIRQFPDHPNGGQRKRPAGQLQGQRGRPHHVHHRAQQVKIQRLGGVAHRKSDDFPVAPFHQINASQRLLGRVVVEPRRHLVAGVPQRRRPHRQNRAGHP